VSLSAIALCPWLWSSSGGRNGEIGRQWVRSMGGLRCCKTPPETLLRNVEPGIVLCTEVRKRLALTFTPARIVGLLCNRSRSQGRWCDNVSATAVLADARAELSPRQIRHFQELYRSRYVLLYCSTYSTAGNVFVAIPRQPGRPYEVLTTRCLVGFGVSPNSSKSRSSD